MAGAKGKEIDQVAGRIVEAREVRLDKAEQVLKELRGK